jgi:hypothetical protein
MAGEYGLDSTRENANYDSAVWRSYLVERRKNRPRRNGSQQSSRQDPLFILTGCGWSHTPFQVLSTGVNCILQAYLNSR